MSTLRYSVIGTGLMGVEHIMNLSVLKNVLNYDLEIVAIADPHEPSRISAITAASPHFNPMQFSDYKIMLQQQHTDVVIIATPNFHHVEVLLYVLKEYPKMHILCEKPMCTTVDDCRKVIDASQSRSGRLWIGLEYRYMPPVARIIEEVRAGTVGRLRMVSIREHRFPFLVKVDNWNRFSVNTGGTLVEKCCHFFDLFNEMNEGRAPISVFAEGAQNVNHLSETYDGKKSDILDNAFVLLQYDNGVRAMLDLCMFAEATHNQEEVCAVGDEGKVEAFLPSHEFRIGRRGEHSIGKVHSEIIIEPKVKFPGHHYGSSQLEHMDFYECIQTSLTPKVSPQNGMISVAVGVAAHLSIQERRVVYMSEILNS
uniref:Gfo/Idh/MocA-like oxidoreductase N-terminal domain-containing protein n=1 Tax=Timspurckia oligopyrenoides TaxID=708627 RepID=A0A7S0ZEL3_9RHOD|mmetsp:Transcript_2290/g.4015  ORF Transcript_2290/g.4015 Transcript_2290/m.4015 type:complete len:368 (+) Transcript_2290:274-1377(+)